MESLECLKSDPLLGLNFIILFTLNGEDLFESSDVILLQSLTENLGLETRQLLVIKISIIVSVQYPEHSLQSLFKVRPKGLAEWVS